MLGVEHRGTKGGPSLYSKGLSCVLFGINGQGLHGGEQPTRPGSHNHWLVSNRV